MDPGREQDAARSAGGWAERLVEHSSQGLAVIDARGVFQAANPTGAALFGATPATIGGHPSPFRPPGRPAGPAAELTAAWDPGRGPRREFSYLLDPVPGEDHWVVSFRDVTDARVHQRRLAAIAAVASEVAAKRSLSSTAEALAHEVLRADGLAGVQILTLDADRDRLHVLGAAGFGREPDFFDKLIACRDRGARLRMLDALSTGAPVVVPHRYEESTEDPAWEPLWEFLRHPRWDTFVSVPMLTRGRPTGVINAFYAPDRAVGDTELGFLVAMAEQAAMAVDQAALVEREGEVARREERQRLAHDLHDSVVQQVFSMMMQATSLGVLVRRGLPPPPERVAQVADELAAVGEDVLADLRGMVGELRPVATAGRGLESALRALCETTAARTGLQVRLDVDDPAGVAGRLGPDLVEDVYRVLAEAVHNSVKHAAATRIDIAVGLAGDPAARSVAGSGRPAVRATVTDDGRGLPAATGRADGDADGGADGGADGDQGSAPGYGMTAMRDRARRWGGQVQVEDVEGSGTRVRLTVPAAVPVPVPPADRWAAGR
ncbi:MULTISPECIES: histidine kinase [unclassified Modestobacter]